MARIRIVGHIISMSALVWTADAVFAQGACPAGRAADGSCVNVSMFNDQRESTMVYSQPKISSTHYPILPSGDWSLRYPNQLTINPPQISPANSLLR